MNNVRGLYPPLYGATPSGGGGGGGGGQHIQVDTLPEASLANKNKIVQYVGATTETLTNAYFYKCVENTGYEWEETEASETYTEAETLPTASAETIGTIYKVDDKYYQTIIVLTYSWDNIDVMEASSGFVVGTTETVVGTFCGKTLYAIAYDNYQLPSVVRGAVLADFTGKQFIGAFGCAKEGAYNLIYQIGTPSSSSDSLTIFQNTSDHKLYMESGGADFNDGKLFAIIFYYKI